MIKNNKLTLVLSSAAILLPAFIGIFIWDMLPDTMATHWNAAGESDGFGTKAFAVIGLPLIILALHWFCVFITEKDPKNKNQSPKMQKLVLWICPVLTWIASGVIYLTALGKEINTMTVVPLLIGVIFVFIGNYMPKVKQSHTLGIRIKWTLENEAVWNKTHRLGGIVYFVSGFVMIISAFLPLKIMIPVMSGVLAAAVIIPAIYSYSVYCKMNKNGELTSDSKNKISPKKKLFGLIFTLVLSIAVLGTLVGVLTTGEIDIVCGEKSFEINADFWNDITVDYSDIDDISLRNDFEGGVRTFGFGSARLLMGSFENAEFGAYTRYTYGKCKTCIIIRNGENILVINAENEAETKALYEEIASKR